MYVSDVQVVVFSWFEDLGQFFIYTYIKSALEVTGRSQQRSIKSVLEVTGRSEERSIKSALEVTGRSQQRSIKSVLEVTGRSEERSIKSVLEVTGRSQQRSIKSVLEVTGRSEERSIKSVLEVTGRSEERCIKYVWEALEHDIIIPPHPTPRRKSEKNRKIAKRLAAFYEPPATYLYEHLLAKSVVDLREEHGLRNKRFGLTCQMNGTHAKSNRDLEWFGERKGWIRQEK